MQGQWKNNISGWNSKHSRRKSQSRKQLMKDKVNYFWKHEDKEPVRMDSVLEYVDDVVVKYGESKNIYKIKINKSYDGYTNYSYRNAYCVCCGCGNFHKRWFDAITSEEIYWNSVRISIISVA